MEIGSCRNRHSCKDLAKQPLLVPNSHPSISTAKVVLDLLLLTTLAQHGLDSHRFWVSVQKELGHRDNLDMSLVIHEKGGFSSKSQLASGYCPERHDRSIFGELRYHERFAGRVAHLDSLA